MKYLTYLKHVVVLLTLCVTIASCSSADPKTVAQKYLDAIAESKINEASKYATESMREQLIKNANDDDPKNDTGKVTHTVLSAVIKGDIASVESKISCNCIMNNAKLTVHMVKQNGHWLVSDVGADGALTIDQGLLLETDAASLATSLTVFNDSKLSTALKVQKKEILDSLTKLQAEIKPDIGLEERAKLQERLLEIQTNYAAFIAEVAAAQMPEQ